MHHFVGYCRPGCRTFLFNRTYEARTLPPKARHEAVATQVKTTIGAVPAFSVKSAYIDGELCALDSHDASSISGLQAAIDQGQTHEMVFVASDLLYLDGEATAALPLLERKERLWVLASRFSRRR